MNKKVSDSEVCQYHLLKHEDINGGGKLFGGRLMEWIDETAAIVARKHCGTDVTTAAIDNLQFKNPAFLNDLVVIEGHLTYVGTSSMEVRVDSYIEDSDGIRHVINRAYLTIVSLDENGHPAKVKYGLDIDTPAQMAEFEGAKKRVAIRKMRKEEGF